MSEILFSFPADLGERESVCLRTAVDETQLAKVSLLFCMAFLE